MPLPTVSESIFEKKSGGGWIALIGLPFFLAGIVIIAVSFIPAGARGGDDFPLYVAIPFGSIFAAVGGVLLFGRSALMIDKKTGTIVQWWGLLRPMRVKEYSIRDIDHITITREIRQTDKSSYTVYPVRLKGSKTTAEIKLSEDRQMRKARHEAEAIAKFLTLPIHDETSGQTRIREPDTFDVSLRDRFRDGLESNEIPETPQGLKSRIDYDGVNLRIFKKPAGMSRKIIILITALGLFELLSIGIISRFVFNDSSDIPVFVAIIVIFFVAGIPSLIIAAVLAKAFISREEIQANAQHLTVTRHFIRQKTKMIPAEELEELFIDQQGASDQAAFKIGNTAVVRARSDTEDITFGSGLPSEELDYIYALTKAEIVS